MSVISAREVCLADGQRYPCATVRVIQDHAIEGLMEAATRKGA